MGKTQKVMKTIRVLVVEDQQMVREALCMILEAEADVIVVGQAADGNSALARNRELRPDVVLMDVGLPDISGIEVTRLLIAETPSVRVLALTSESTQSIATRMLASGALGFVHKSAGKDEVLAGIRAIASGAHYLSPNISAILVTQLLGKDRAEAKGSLTKRETDVLTKVSQGMNSRQIGEQLHIAPSTVEVHRHNIMRKLDLHTVADLTKYAVRERLT